MTPEQLKQLAIQEKTQVNVRLPSGEIIPAGLNPGEAATLDVFSALTANRQVNVQNAPQLSSALTQVGIQQLGGLPQQAQDPGGVQFLFGRNERIPELGQILGVSEQRPGLTAGGGAEDIASQFRGTRPVTDTFVNPNKDFFSPQQTSSVTTPARPSPTAIQDLQGSVAITAIEKRVDDIASRLSAGIAAGGAEEILEGLFERFDIKEETDLLNSYNQIILEKTQQLRSLPDDIKKSLEDVGISESQYNRIVQKESQKPLEVLRDLMELKGVAQDRIDQSLKFVGLFADAQMQDKAAKLEALKLELELAQGKFEDLREDQKELIKQGIDTQKNILSKIDQAQRDGAPADLITKAQAATTEEEAQSVLAPFYAQQGEIATAGDIAPGIANQIAGMSDSQALQFVQQQAVKFGVGVDALLNAVEAEEGKVAEGTTLFGPEDKRQISQAGLDNADQQIKSEFVNSPPLFKSWFIRNQLGGDITKEEFVKAAEKWEAEEEGLGDLNSVAERFVAVQFETKKFSLKGTELDDAKEKAIEIINAQGGIKGLGEDMKNEVIEIIKSFSGREDANRILNLKKLLAS